MILPGEKECGICSKELMRGDYVYGTCHECAKKALTKVSFKTQQFVDWAFCEIAMLRGKVHDLEIDLRRASVPCGCKPEGVLDHMKENLDQRKGR